ncbi:protein of unknown function [Taphrina deformans PYCC 5710]|uniref:Uncharacterized protein n=1 Tax=Taphrina deformans (strain PYCC 5710 / ATCC 11124 / CBS 356.35 / IMI 108563 / JCM 9778 / NBRC 8474) TaxID=1097556 RepID=R4XK17_TAPDE|nr:protein of unknown function [Taphrina deformans PYCC 5710]|eukprot:CCG83658.1 protein of unknown function [Taphrina deformans PYCC 5710]
MSSPVSSYSDDSEREDELWTPSTASYARQSTNKGHMPLTPPMSSRTESGSRFPRQPYPHYGLFPETHLMSRAPQDVHTIDSFPNTANISDLYATNANGNDYSLCFMNQPQPMMPIPSTIDAFSSAYTSPATAYSPFVDSPAGPQHSTPTLTGSEYHLQQPHYSMPPTWDIGVASRRLQYVTAADMDGTDDGKLDGGPLFLNHAMRVPSQLMDYRAFEHCGPLNGSVFPSPLSQYHSTFQ